MSPILDYHALLSPELWDYMRISDSFSAGAEASLAEHRAAYNRLCQYFQAQYPAGVSASDSFIDYADQRIPIRQYQLAGSQPSAQVLYFHGGGFVFGDLESHDSILAELCAGTGFKVTSVDYRLAPEHAYPAAFEDAWASYQALSAAEQALPIILAGDSAGANLAAGVVHTARHSAVKARGLLLIYPWLGSDFTSASLIEHAHAPQLSTQDVRAFQRLYLGGAAVPNDVPFAPLNDQDFSGLPSLFAVAADCDPLADEALHYCEKVQAAGGKAECVIEQGLVHGYLRARHSVPEAGASFDSFQ